MDETGEGRDSPLSMCRRPVGKAPSVRVAHPLARVRKACYVVPELLGRRGPALLPPDPDSAQPLRRPTVVGRTPLTSQDAPTSVSIGELTSPSATGMLDLSLD